MCAYVRERDRETETERERQRERDREGGMGGRTDRQMDRRERENTSYNYTTLQVTFVD